MRLVTLEDVRALAQTSLSDDALQAVIDREEGELVRRHGAHYVDEVTPVTELYRGRYAALLVRRPIEDVERITEDGEELDPEDDYEVWCDEGKIVRLPLGARWGQRVTVEYVPVDDNATRRAVLIELVRLALSRTALRSESVAGEYSYQAPEWEAERAALLRRLRYDL